MTNTGKPLYSLVSLDDFKALMDLDDRDDKLAGFCVVTATHSIEQYCKRRLLRKKHFERLAYTGDLLLPLREYPVSKILAAFAIRNEGRKLGIMNDELGTGVGEIIEPDFYSVVPDCGTDIDIPFDILLSPAMKWYRGLTAVKTVYWAGYTLMNTPADLASACFELAAWNLNRYRGKRIGLTGNVRGNGKDGEHLELSMPMRVRELLEPYKRKGI